MKRLSIGCAFLCAILCTALAIQALSPASAMAQSSPFPLWPQGAPGPSAAATPETVRLTPQGEHVVSGIRQPSLTPYLPAPGTATGAAVIIAPGGGHVELWMDHEGYNVGKWLSAHGIAAFVLKYRLSKEPGSPYSLEGDSLGDMQRAVRLVRSRSVEWSIDPDRVGVMGFSAGGELAALASWRDPVATGPGADAVDHQSAKPSFEALIYPGLPQHGAFSAATPPAFLLGGDQDRPQIAEGLADLYLQIHRAGGSAEVHLLAGVGHGFGLRDSNPAAVRAWPVLFYTWLDAKGFLTPLPAKPSAPAQVSSAMRSGIPDAAFVDRYTPDARAAAVQTALHLAKPPHLGAPVSLTPNQAYADGAALNIWKPSFVLGSRDGGEAGINFWDLHSEGHINLAFTPRTAKAHLLDCRFLSAGPVTYKIYAEGADTPASQGQVALAAHHLLLAVPEKTALVEMWPAPASEVIGFFGCDVSEME